MAMALKIWGSLAIIDGEMEGKWEMQRRMPGVKLKMLMLMIVMFSRSRSGVTFRPDGVVITAVDETNTDKKP